ncbi:zinc finger domain-containing protein [Streptomyces sp. MJM1172]|uniref:zinc finger domain-containing protein n=1 Tax=Streptomyces sp. MJM1172 TaxID=1703926 RepID=UPI00093FEB5F
MAWRPARTPRSGLRRSPFAKVLSKPARCAKCFWTGRRLGSHARSGGIGVERHDCPNCDAPVGSACRIRGGKTAAKYHPLRFVPARRAHRAWVRYPASVPRILWFGRGTGPGAVSAGRTSVQATAPAHGRGGACPRHAECNELS